MNTTDHHTGSRRSYDTRRSMEAFALVREELKHERALKAELLSALQAVYRQTVTLRLPPDANCLQMVAAAIAKAEGRSA